MIKTIRYIAIISFAVLILGDNLSGVHPYRRALMDSINYQRMWENLLVLSGASESDEYAYIPSRHSHHPSLTTAADYIATKFTEIGYTPVLDSFGQCIDIFALDYSSGLIAACGRHSAFLDDPANNLADSVITRYPFRRTPYYHTTDDTYETIDSTQFYHAARAAIASMIRV